MGEGASDAALVLVGEQPGDREDIEGHPFVGPAGTVLDKGLEQAGIARDEVYITNAVKHFRYKARGKRRIHQKPAASRSSPISRSWSRSPPIPRRSFALRMTSAGRRWTSSSPT
jgi:uracil-DNA glycosylase